MLNLSLSLSLLYFESRENATISVGCLSAMASATSRVQGFLAMGFVPRPQTPNPKLQVVSVFRLAVEASGNEGLG